MKKTLDFICIGAAKSATSTLFELIEGHPEIYVPPAKEVPYFNDDELYDKGWKWYMKTFFADAKKDQITGTMTPQYMSGNGVNTPEVIAERIHEQIPHGRIIALLRSPVSRSHSHYKMHKRHGYLDETFEKSVDQLLNSNLESERSNLSQKNSFLFASEYGRILSHYYELFPKERILVLFTDDFQKDPTAVLKRVLNFLNVDGSYMPPNINRQTNRGGSSAKIKYLNSAYVHKVPLIKFLWQRLVPIKLRKKIYMKVLFWNTKTDNIQLDPNSPTYKKLVKHFKSDIALLESVTGQKVPWQDWR